MTPLGAATISGVVKNDRGSVVTSAVVRAVKRRTVIIGDVVAAGETKVNQKGEFSLTVESAGTYGICVETLAEALDSCRWGGPLLVVDVPSASSTFNVPVTLSSGLNVVFRVDDPNQLLTEAALEKSKALLIFGVWTSDGRYIPARRVQDSKTSVSYAITVPLDADVALEVLANGVKVLDGSGSVIPSGIVAKFRARAGDAKLGQQFRVTAP